MALTVDWNAGIVYSDASINDVPAHHIALRDLEESATGVLYPPICAWSNSDLGGGASFSQVDYINGYRLQFIGPGPFTITGNLNAPIIDTGVQVERKTSAAFVTTAVGGSGPSAAEIAAAILAAAQITPIHAAYVSGRIKRWNGSAWV